MGLRMTALIEVRDIIEAEREAPRTHPRAPWARGRFAASLGGVRRLIRVLLSFGTVFAPAAIAVEGGRGSAEGCAAPTEAAGGTAAGACLRGGVTAGGGAGSAGGRLAGVLSAIEVAVVALSLLG